MDRHSVVVVAGQIEKRLADSRMATRGARSKRSEPRSLVGITRKTVLRIMSRWAKDLVVTTERDGFRIADPDRLRCLDGETSAARQLATRLGDDQDGRGVAGGRRVVILETRDDGPRSLRQR